MKIVIAHNRYSSAQPSGENTVVDAEIAQLTDAGATVVPFLRSSDEIADLSPPGKAALALSPIYARKTQARLAELLAAERPDVLHLHNPYPFLSPAVVRTAQSRGVPVVQTVHNYRHVCVAGVYFRDGHICHDCRGKRFGLPGVVHGCYRGSRPQSLIMATTLAVNRSTWRGVDRFIALTEGIAAYLRDFGVADEQISVKPNSMPDPGAADGPGEGFVFVGRLTAEKGILLLLDAWRRHPVGQLGRLRIIGDGPERERVEAVAASREDIEFLGPVEHADGMAIVRSAAALVAPSLWEDVLPTVIIEALGCARPVLTTTLGGSPHMIGADSAAAAGMAVEPTAEALAAALPRMRDAAPTLTGHARRRYEEQFTPEAVIKRLLDIYADVCR